MAQITKEQLVSKINEAENVLVLMNTNPNLEQLGASIGMVDLLHDLNKTAVLVHDKELSSALDFLKPNEVMSQDVEPLRDFIISLKQEKVDKFRYIQEDDNYSILLTPNGREAIEEADIEYRKGDFNIDLVIALGIENLSQICSTVVKHDQLVHELPMVNILSSGQETQIDADIWQQDSNADCGLGEMIYELSQVLEFKALGHRTANALLTSMIGRTDHFKNDMTYPRTMHISGELLNYGADIKLITESLDKLDDVSMADTREMIEEVLEEETDIEVKSTPARMVSKNKKANKKKSYIKYGVDNQVKMGKGQNAKKLEEEKPSLDIVKINDDGEYEVLGNEDEEKEKSASSTTTISKTSTGNTIKPPTKEELASLPTISSLNQDDNKITESAPSIKPLKEASVEQSINQFASSENLPDMSFNPLPTTDIATNSHVVGDDFANLDVPDASNLTGVDPVNAQHEGASSVADSVSDEVASSISSAVDSESSIQNDYINAMSSNDNEGLASMGSSDVNPLDGQSQQNQFTDNNLDMSTPPPLSSLTNTDNMIEQNMASINASLNDDNVALPPVSSDASSNEGGNNQAYIPPTAPPLASMT